jgi:dTMP kinase
MEYLASVVGLSGSGKSTAITGTRALLAAEGITSASFHDRTSDPESAKLDSLLHTADLSPEARMHLILAIRRQVIDRQIIPSLSQHDVTITDRYYPCTIAYQAYGEGLNRNIVTQAAISAAQGALPNRIFLLDLPGPIAKLRMQARAEPQQIFDAEAVAFHERVRHGYLAQAAVDERFAVVDALSSRETVAQFIADTISYDLRSSS